MKKKSKRYKSIESVNQQFDSLKDGIDKVKGMVVTKFDESIDVSIRLNIEKKHTVRDVVSFPHSFGRSRKVMVFVKDERVEEAKKAGADYVGNTEFVEKISKGWMDFDVAIATPNMMKDIVKVARFLGSKGLMPNPKTKTVTEDIVKVIKEIKAGRKEFRADSDGNLNFSIGKKSMLVEKIAENYKEFLNQVLKKKPSDLKGDYIKSIFLSSTMSKSVQLDKKVNQ